MKRIWFLKHPLHPTLVHFPIGLWSLAFFWDLAFAFTANTFWWAFAFWSLAAGLVIGLLTAFTGLLDLLAMANNHPAKPKGFAHMAIMLYLFAHQCLNAWAHSHFVTQRDQWLWLGLCLSASGSLVLGFGAWLGGFLVYDEAVGTVYATTVFRSTVFIPGQTEE